MSDEATAVLVVEDEPLVRMLVADVLVEAGFRVIEAVNADEALSILSARDDIPCSCPTSICLAGFTVTLWLARFISAGLRSRSSSPPAASGRAPATSRPARPFWPNPALMTCSSRTFRRRPRGRSPRDRAAQLARMRRRTTRP